MLPVKGNLRGHIDTYVKLAKEKPVSKTEIEGLRLSLENFFKQRGEWGFSIWWDPETVTKPTSTSDILRDLENAKSRSEKVIAIDRAMGLVHGEGRAIQYMTHTTETRGEREITPVLEKIFGKLANE